MKTLKTFSNALGTAIATLLLATAYATQASTFWNGPNILVFHPAGGAPDAITNNVYFNRGTSSGGLYNSGTNNGSTTAIETGPGSGSPKGTLWVQGALSNNISPASFTTCPLEAGHHPPGDVGTTFVVHLLTNDIYLQLTLTNWGGAGQSGNMTFGYIRSTPTVPPSITNPIAGASFGAPANVTFQATVLTNVPMQFTNVQFFTNNVLVASVNSKPFNFTANNLGAGSYSLTSVEIADGIATTSAPVNFSVSTPVSVSITNPAAGEVFSTPANVAIQPDLAQDSTASNVQFFSNNTSLGSASSSPFDFTNSFGVGSYSLTAVATAGGINTTSAAVNISVVTPTTVSLGGSVATGSTNFGFSYAANVGLSYVVQVSTNLTGTWVSLVTNVAASNPVVFEDPNATNIAGYYRVGLLPNP
jgi:hypothetical protein